MWMGSWIHVVRGIHRSPVSSSHKCQGGGALVLSLICAWTNDWVTIETPVIWGDIALIMDRVHYGPLSDAHTWRTVKTMRGQHSFYGPPWEILPLSFSVSSPSRSTPLCLETASSSSQTPNSPPGEIVGGPPWLGWNAHWKKIGVK